MRALKLFWDFGYSRILRNNSSPWGHWNCVRIGHSRECVVTTQAHEGIETCKWKASNGVNNVTTQAHEGIETLLRGESYDMSVVTTQAHEGIETPARFVNKLITDVTTQAHEGIETRIR